MVDEAQFPGQQEGEEIIIFARRHWYVLSQWLRVPFLLLFLSALVTRFAFSYLDIKGTKAILAWPIALMPASLWIIWRALDWWNDHYIVTDRRVIHRAGLRSYGEEGGSPPRYDPGRHRRVAHHYVEPAGLRQCAHRHCWRSRHHCLQLHIQSTGGASSTFIAYSKGARRRGVGAQRAAGP